MQELLEILGIPYTGPGVAACGRCMDKVLGQARAARRRGPDPRLVRLQRDRLPRARRRRRARARSRSGSASRWWSSRPRRVGARGEVRGELRSRSPRRSSPPSATTTGCCSSASSRAASSPSACSAATPLPVVEAIPREGDLYDFEARYEIGRTEFVCPAELGERRGRRRDRRRRCAPTRRSAARASPAST